MANPLKNNWIETSKRIVVKIGSNVLTENHSLNISAIQSISRQISALRDKGLEVLLVSSGAMASGVRKLGLSKRPDEIPKRQAVAAVGQPGLMMEYERAFERFNRKVAQILLTGDGISNRKRYLNVRNTLHTLLSWDVIPIINENDTVSVEEIKFGDNDNLAAIIALSMDADILIILTDINGLYSKDPRNHPDAELIPEIHTITAEHETISSGLPGALGTGGMISKIKAARKVTAAGIPMIIAKGDTPDILLKLYAGEKHGTFFVPQNKKLTNRKRWIALTQKPKGIIRIDDGAFAAMMSNGKSLLAKGITGVEGEFSEGSPVSVVNRNDGVLGTGLVNYSADDIRKIMGLNSSQIKDCLGYKPYDEVIHRDNMVLKK